MNVSSDHPEDQINNNSRKKYKCEHGRQRSKCKDCGGIGICEHDKIRTNCRACGGSGICEHDIRRDRCTKCNYFKKCHPCKIINALQEKISLRYNRNVNIIRERELLAQINIKSDLVYLGTKMLLLLQ